MSGNQLSARLHQLAQKTNPNTGRFLRIVFEAVVPVGVFEADRKFRSGSNPRPASTSIVWSPLRTRTTLRVQSKASDGRNMSFSHYARTGSTLWANIAVDSDSTPTLTTSDYRV